MDLRSVDVADLNSVWPVAEPWLARACARPGSDLSTDALRAIVDAQQGALLLVFDRGRPVTAGVTQVRQYQDGRLSCWVLAVGGVGIWTWRDVLVRIETGAANVGCGTVEFVGRLGWRRLLPDYAAAPCEAGTHFTKILGA